MATVANVRFLVRVTSWLLVAHVAVGCHGSCGPIGSPYVRGSGKLASQTREVGEFTAIVLQGAADAKVSVGKPKSVEIRADDNLLDVVETEVRNGTLVVRTRGSYSSGHPIQVFVSVPKLGALSIEGSGSAAIGGLKDGTLDLSISGSGDIVAEGRADSVRATVRGSGEMDLHGLVTKTAAASISGSGNLKVHAAESLEATIRGSGDIEYFGNPAKVVRSISGSGEIRRR